MDKNLTLRPSTISVSTPESIHAVNSITQDTRYNIVHAVLGHPEGSPSMRELSYSIDMSTGAISGHLDTLVEEGILDPKIVPQSKRSRGMPTTFYELSDHGTEVMDEYGLLSEDMVDAYGRIFAESDEIEDYLEAPRPD